MYSETPQSKCENCGRILMGASSVQGDRTPHPGALSICGGCSAISIFDDDMRLRGLTQEELDKILAHKPTLYLLAKAVGVVRFVKAARN